MHSEPTHVHMGDTYRERNPRSPIMVFRAFVWDCHGTTVELRSYSTDHAKPVIRFVELEDLQEQYELVVPNYIGTVVATLPEKVLAHV